MYFLNGSRVAICIMFSENMRKTFGTGLFGDRQGKDEREREKTKRLSKRGDRVIGRMTMMLAGASSSVWKRLLGDKAVLNFATRPLREMTSPTFTNFRTVAELEKTNEPFDARKSSDLSPAM